MWETNSLIKTKIYAHRKKTEKHLTDDYSYCYDMKLSIHKKLYLRLRGKVAFPFSAFGTSTENL